MAKAVGIDLGTTNSVVAVLEGGEAHVIANAEGARTTPSIVGISKTGEPLVGEVAKRQSVTSPDRTIISVKRQMGTDWSIEIDGATYTAQEISARILAKLKRDAEAYLGSDVVDAVITVPAYFGDAERQATKEAGEIAGLNVLRIVNEPTAAALAYGLDENAGDQTILVYDLGGGTFDVSVLEIAGGVFDVRSTSGDTHLGGDDWDDAIVQWMLKEFSNTEGVDLSGDSTTLQRLKEAAEKAKRELSAALETSISLPFIASKDDGPVHLEMTLTRAQFEQLTEDLLERTREPFLAALSDAGMTCVDIDTVLLVGGSTRMPAVQKLVSDLCGGKEASKTVNPDEVVSCGAAQQAGVLRGEVKDILLLDVTPLTLGIETKGGVMQRMIERNTTIPTRSVEVFTTAADNQNEVEIHVLQGERDMAAHNVSLGKFGLADLPPAPRGVPQIEVCFDIDANGIVHVSATDKATGKAQSVTITGQSALPRDEIDRMIRDAEEHAKADTAARDLAEARNNADVLTFQAERLQRDHGGQIGDAEAAALRGALATVATAAQGEDVRAIRAASEELMRATTAAGGSVHDAAAAPVATPVSEPVDEALAETVAQFDDDLPGGTADAATPAEDANDNEDAKDAGAAGDPEGDDRETVTVGAGSSDDTNDDAAFESFFED